LSAESKNSSPLPEVWDRLGEQSAALGLPRLLAVQNLANLWSDNRKRVHDSHRAQMKSLGVDIPEELADDMISVRGDTTNHITYAMPQPSLLSKCLPYALTLGLGAGGLLAWQWWNEKPATTPPAATDVDTNWKLGVEVKQSP